MSDRAFVLLLVGLWLWAVGMAVAAAIAWGAYHGVIGTALAAALSWAWVVWWVVVR